MVNRLRVCGVIRMSAANCATSDSRSAAPFKSSSRSVLEISFSRFGRLSNVRCRTSSWAAEALSTAMPRSSGVRTTSASTYSRALASKVFGMAKVTAQPTTQTSHEKNTAGQR